jgi:hypothetical protein
LRLTAGGSIKAVRNEDGSAGALRLFLDGQVSPHSVLDMDDGAIGIGGLPKNIQIYYGGKENLSISGNSMVSGTIYAPNANLEMKGQAIIHGAVLSDTFRMGNDSTIYYDNSLTKGDCWGRDRLPELPRGGSPAQK